MATPLDGIRVVDLTIAGAGPRAGRMLAEFGAEVIKVESAIDADVMLTRPPKQRGWPVGYTHYNRGKKAVFLNLRDPGDRQLAHELIRRSDVFLNNMRPGVAERLGVAYEQLHEINPRIIYGYLSAWDRSGPLASWPGADPVVQFYSGWCSIQGQEGGAGEFGRFVGHIDDSGAVSLVAGILQALLDRQVTGLGQRVDVSLLQASLAAQITRLAEFFGGAAPEPLGTASATTYPHEAFKCGDGNYLAVGVENDTTWRGLCAALAVPDLAKDPQFATNPDRVRNRALLRPILTRLFAAQPSNWWQIVLQRHRVPHSRFYDWENIRYHAQVQENDFISLVDVPHQGPLYLVNPPWSSNVWSRPALAAERPGEHSEEIRTWLANQQPTVAVTGVSNHHHRQNGSSDAQVRKALAGITVVDATQGLCGPYASQLLVDAGANVIKIEPIGGDPARQMGPPFIDGVSAVFLTLNRGKKSVCLDVNADEGRAQLRSLVRSADIFLEDWGTGVADRSGCGYARLSADHADLIYCAVTPFGEVGPLTDRPGSELILQAVTEYTLGLGTVGGPPVRVGADIASTSTALYAFDAMLAAVYDRSRTGRGNRISVSQFGTLLYTRGTAWASQSDPDDWDGWAARPYYPPDYGYQARDGKVYFIILRGDQETFDSLMIELGLEEWLLDPRFANGGRDAVGIGRYAAEVKPIWEAVFQERTIAELTELVQAHGGLIAPLHTYQSLFADPRVAPLNLIASVDLAGGATMSTLQSAWTLSALSNDVGSRPPLLGEHNDVVFHDAPHR